MKTIKTFTAIIILISSFSFVKAQDSPEQTRQILNDMYNAMNSKDLKTAISLIDANIVDHIPFTADQKPGIEGINDVFGILYTAFPDFNQEVIDLIISPDGKKAAALVKIRGTNSGEFMGMKATNNKIDVLGCDIMYVNNGKMTDHWGFIDSETMMKQLGMTK